MADEKTSVSSILGKKPDEAPKTDPANSTSLTPADPAASAALASGDPLANQPGPVQTGIDPAATAPIIDQTGTIVGEIQTSDSAWIAPSSFLESDAGSVGNAQVRTTKERRVMPISEEDAIRRDNGELVETFTPVAAYKHRGVRHFVVGGFEFVNHVLYIYSDEANERFLDLYETLPPRDRNEIVVYDFEAARRVETPVAVSRGSMNTSALKDPKVVQA